MKNGLKFWSLALIVALIAGFASCKKDDNKEKEPNIEGQWKLDKNAPTIIPSLNQCELDDASNFRNFMKAPDTWAETHDGYSVAPTAAVNGFDTFIFKVDATGKEYFFQNNTDLGGRIVWQNLDTGEWNILY